MTKKAKHHKYPSPDKITIDEANFELQLEEYHKAIKSKPSLTDFLIIVPAWAIIFTSDFRGFLGFSGEVVKGFYIASIAIATVTIVARFIGVAIPRLPFRKKNSNSRGRQISEPNEKVKSIKNNCS